MSDKPLGNEQLRVAVEGLDNWKLENERLVKHFEFGSFKEAVAFIVRLGFHAEELGHHPEIHNVYNKVQIALTTHDAGNKVTERDIRLARVIDGFSWV